MRKIFAVMLAGGMLLAGAVAASAKFDSQPSAPALHVQTGASQNNAAGNQTGNNAQNANDKGVNNTKPAAKPATTSATKPATTTGQDGANDQCGFNGEFNGEQQDTGACNTQDGQSGTNEKTTANDTIESTGNQEN
jgi:hypothetical protein